MLEYSADITDELNESLTRKFLGGVGFPNPSYADINAAHWVESPTSHLAVPIDTVDEVVAQFVPQGIMAAPIVLDEDLAKELGPYASLNSPGIALDNRTAAYPHLNPRGEVLMLVQDEATGAYQYEDLTRRRSENLLSNLGIVGGEARLAQRNGYALNLFEAFSGYSDFLAMLREFERLKADPRVTKASLEVYEPTMALDAAAQRIFFTGSHFALTFEKEPLARLLTWNPGLFVNPNPEFQVLKPEEVEAAVAEAKSQGKSFRLDLD